jgi:predicted Zn-dependent protease
VRIQLLADERAESDVPDILRVGGIITRTYGHEVVASFRPGMFDGSVIDGKLDPARYGAAAPTLTLTGYDLQPSGLNFAFGVTSGDASLVSTARLQSDGWRLIVVALHEVGHMLGLVDSLCRNYDSRHYFQGHCRNTCLMQAANSLSDIDRCVDNFMQGISLCDECREYLR